jgi:hypothetical protein
MTAAAVRVTDRRRAGLWRLGVIWAVLLAFALQSYVTQTHVHPTAVAADAAAIQPAARASAEQAPAGGGEALACPLCQAVSVAGAFVAPGAVGVLPLTVWPVPVSRAPTKPGRAVALAGFAWRSRAPPQS